MPDARINYTEPETLFAQTVQRRMDELNLSIRELADKTGSTYENIRKIVRGTSLPSKYFVRTIAHVLGLDEGEMTDMVAADKIKHKFGGVPELLAKKNPELVPIERLWSALTTAQKDNVLEMVRTYAKRNREKKAIS